MTPAPELDQLSEIIGRPVELYRRPGWRRRLGHLIFRSHDADAVFVCNGDGTTPAHFGFQCSVCHSQKAWRL